MLAPREVAYARPARLIAGLLLAGVLGCAHQPATTAPPSPHAASPAPQAPAPPGSASGTVPEPGAASAPAPPASPPARAATGTAAPAPAPRRPAPASAAPAVRTTPGARTSPAAASAASAASAAPPALDLASLEQRLRETHAIGVFTKLSLKNQVDDLLAQFRAFYAGQGDLTLTGLRRTYELLLMKVVTLLQDEDPGLASAVTSSREAIWALLSDRNRFNNL